VKELKMPETFETRVWNKTEERVEVYDRNGQVVCVVLPDKIALIESANENTLYAPYSELIFQKDGEVILAKRENWTESYDKTKPWIVTIENREGKDLEQRVIAGQRVFIPKGIPVKLHVPTHAPEARLEKIVIQKVMERRPSPTFTGYYVRIDVVRDVAVERPEKELKEIDAELGHMVNKQASKDHR
jgi:hypothetical protein